MALDNKISALASAIGTEVKSKQVGLVSGINIKTLYGQTLLGSGGLSTPTTLSGYGISDAYTKTEIDLVVGDINSALDTINGQVI